MSDHPVSQEEVQRTEFARKMIIRKILSKQAMERLARVKLVKPDLALQLEDYLISLHRAGKVRSEVSEEQMKAILETISGINPPTRSIKIVRK